MLRTSGILRHQSQLSWTSMAIVFGISVPSAMLITSLTLFRFPFWVVELRWQSICVKIDIQSKFVCICMSMSVSQYICRCLYGTKELLIIDMTISQQLSRYHKGLLTCWIDNKKAYDSVPHTWHLREMYKVVATLCIFLKTCMRQWRNVFNYPGCRIIHGYGLPM